jgi:hypothetical protein
MHMKRKGVFHNCAKPCRFTDTALFSRPESAFPVDGNHFDDTPFVGRDTCRGCRRFASKFRQSNSVHDFEQAAFCAASGTHGDTAQQQDRLSPRPTRSRWPEKSTRIGPNDDLPLEVLREVGTSTVRGSDNGTQHDLRSTTKGQGEDETTTSSAAPRGAGHDGPCGRRDRRGHIDA